MYSSICLFLFLCSIQALLSQLIFLALVDIFSYVIVVQIDVQIDDQIHSLAYAKCMLDHLAIPSTNKKRFLK